MHLAQERLLHRRELRALHHLAVPGPAPHVAVGIDLPGIEHGEERSLDAAALDEQRVGGDEHIPLILR
eukprot:8398490-Pyramimonas_sp.AAC.1